MAKANMIVGLGHQARVGKDTAANFLVERHGFKRLAFADTLKQVLYDINPIVSSPPRRLVRVQDIVEERGWEDAKNMFEVRRLLQDLGMAARDHIGVNSWVNAVLRQVDIYGDYVITDVRFPNEFDALWNKQAHLIRITRPDSQRHGNAGTHQSEIALDDADWHSTIENNGSLLELEQNLIGVLGL